jgi:TolA-binding protein
MADLSLNRLRCSDCKAFRSITDFPFENGFRKPTCTKRKLRRVNRRMVQMEHQRIRIQKEQEKQEKDRQWRIKANESALELGMPLRCLDC